MSVDSKLASLLDAAEGLGIAVRHVDLDGRGGGLCTLKGQRVIFVDVSCDRATRYDCVLREFCRLSEIETIYLRPEIREDMDRVNRED